MRPGANTQVANGTKFNGTNLCELNFYTFDTETASQVWCAPES